jgi:23S rRNA (guanosine2251-2'-O)-methyltransferase
MKKKLQSDQIIGFRPIIEAILAGKTISKIFLKKGSGGDLFHECFNLIRKYEIPFQYVPVEKLNQLSRSNHQGVIALISPIPYNDITQIIPTLFEAGKDPFILVLDGITDIRNFGGICRSAEAAGIDAIIVGTKKAAMINSDAIKTSAGALNRIPVCREENLEKTILFLKNSGLKIISASEKAQTPYYQEKLTDPLALVMGAEDTGISANLITESDSLIKIPMAGKIASLNVGVACGVIIFEVLRQKMIRLSN